MLLILRLPLLQGAGPRPSDKKYANNITIAAETAPGDIMAIPPAAVATPLPPFRTNGKKSVPTGLNPADKAFRTKKWLL
jgi:type IV secretory pathway protease TraF